MNFEEWFEENMAEEFSRLGEHAYEYQQVKIDKLQGQINKTIAHIEDWYGCVELSTIVDMLNGEQEAEQHRPNVDISP